MASNKRFATKLTGGLRWSAPILACVLVPSSPAQTSQAPATAKFDKQVALDRLKRGEVNPHDLNQLGQTQSKEAIPSLEKQFFASNQELDKAQIAQVLVRLKDTNPTYWNFLERAVTKFLDNPSPSPIAEDAQGKEIQGVSPAFEAWVDANRLDPPTALQNATLVDPAFVVLLGETGDPRAIPLLRRGLASPNYLIAASASGELAELKDEDSVPLVADAAAKAPAKAAALIAEPMGYLKGAQAQSVFTRYVPVNRANTVRERARSGQSPVQ